jgi:predicted enzyme related to lactoylglutathione lyase
VRDRPGALAAYVEVESIAAATAQAVALGASVMLAPREGPAGLRSVVTTPAGGEIAVWQTNR